MQEFQAVASVIIIVLAVIFLIFGVAVVAIVFRILTNVRRIVQRVDETSANLNEMTKYMGKKLGPAALTAFGSFMLKRAKSKVTRRK